MSIQPTHKDLPLAKENTIRGLDGEKLPTRAKTLTPRADLANLSVAVQFGTSAVVQRTSSRPSTPTTPPITPKTPIEHPNAKGYARLNAALVTGADAAIVQIGSSAVLQRRSRPSTPTTPVESNSTSTTAQTSSSTSSTTAAYKSYQPVYSIPEVDEKKETYDV